MTFFEVARCCIGTFFASRSWFPDHLPSCGSSWAQEEVVAGCGFNTLEYVSVGCVMFCVDWCCVGTNSGHNSCFHTDFRAAGPVATKTVNPAMPSSIPSSWLHTAKRKQGYFDGLRKRRAVSCDPQEQKKLHFSMISGRTSSV